MSLLSGVYDFFGLDIGTTAIRLVQLRGGGSVKTLVKYAYVPVDGRLVVSDAKADQQQLAKVIKDLVDEAGLTTTNVAVGLPSNKVFAAVVDIDNLPAKELAKTIQYQADSLIPTPLAESKYDWALLGESPKDKSKVEILLTSVTNDFVETRLDLLESIGLNVIAFEPESIAITRALLPPNNPSPQLILDIGGKSADLIVTMNGTPRLIRSIPAGSDAVVRAAMQNLNIEQEQARQLVFKFGLNKDKLEGQIYQAIIGAVDVLVAEIDKSIKFFQTRYAQGKIDHIILTGGASSLPDFPLYIANKFMTDVEMGNAWRNVSFPGDRQNELLALSSHFAVATGLAGRVE